MTSLYLDTSSNFLYTAILEDKKVICEIKEKLDKELSKKTLPYINNMLINSQITPNQIEKIIVVNGPGSFTGIRIGLTIAKTFAWARNIPIITVSSLEAMAFSNDVDTDYVVPAIDARRGYVFATIYDNQNKKFILKEQYIAIKTLEIAMENLAGNITILSNDNLETSYPIVSYQPDFTKIVTQIQNKEPQNPHAIDANYLKRTEAEENHDC